MNNLPLELKGNIYSKVTKNIISELKYSSKETYDSMRYLTHLNGNISLKSLSSKIKTTVYPPSITT